MNEQPKLIKFVIAIAGTTRKVRVRGSRRPATFFVTEVSFANAAGTRPTRVKRVGWSPDAQKAARFGKLTAEELAQHLTGPTWRLAAWVEPETSLSDAERQERRANAQAMQASMAAEARRQAALALKPIADVLRPIMLDFLMGREARHGS
jgi:hypothetical protein